MRKITCFAVAVIFLAASATAFGKDFWKEKKYEKWSQRECNKMLTDSPWAQDFTLIDTGLERSARTSDDGRQLYIKYQMQFASALPIRQAQVRQMQIVQNYDKLEPEQRQQADQNANRFLSAKFPDAVIVFVTYETNNSTIGMDLDRHWQAQTTDLLRNKVFLRNSRGDRVDLAQFTSYQGSGERAFQFIFPRQTEDGKELVDPEDKNLMLEFTYPVISVPGAFGDRLGNGEGFMEFKPEKMVLNGELTY